VAETPVESNGRVFRLGDIATVTHGFADPPSFVVRQEGKSAIGIGVVTAKGANILELGKDVAAATAEFMKAVAAGHQCRPHRRPAGSGGACGQRIRALLHRGAGDRFVRLVRRTWLADRHRGGAIGAAGAVDRLHRHERDVARSASDHARCADHRARPVGGRRHYRRRDDGW